jgi:hypothetical protein
MSLSKKFSMFFRLTNRLQVVRYRFTAVHIEYKYTSGGIVIVADVATFELIKHTSTAYYEACPELVGEAFIQKQTDKSKNANLVITGSAVDVSVNVTDVSV